MAFYETLEEDWQKEVVKGLWDHAREGGNTVNKKQMQKTLDNIKAEYDRRTAWKWTNTEEIPYVYNNSNLHF